MGTDETVRSKEGESLHTRRSCVEARPPERERWRPDGTRLQNLLHGFDLVVVSSGARRAPNHEGKQVYTTWS